MIFHIISIIGATIMVGLFAFAFSWPWIAEEIIIRKHEKKEEKAPYLRICYCRNCGYNGRISLARNANYNRFLQDVVWHCPQCGKIILWNSEIKYVRREYAEELQKGGDK